MVRSSKIKVLFIPYQKKPSGHPNEDLPNSDHREGQVSWQKHASREYHRRNALKKASRVAPFGSAQRPGYYSSLYKKHTSKPQIDTIGTLTEDDSQRVPQGFEMSLPIGDVACSQLDPFGVMVRADMPKYAQKMFHHAFVNVWDIGNFGTGKNGNITNTVLISSMTSSATFYSNVFAGTTHLAWLRSPDAATLREHKLIQIQAKGLALAHMRQEVARIKTYVSDELLFAMLVMAAYSNGDSFDYSGDETRSVGPRAFSYDGGYYGTVEFEPAHLVSMIRLLQMRGGLHTIKLPGLREVFTLADILCASKSIQAPYFPLFRPTEKTMSELPRYDCRAGVNPEYLPDGFHQLPSVFESHRILTIVRHMRLTALSYEDYIAQSSDAPLLDSLRFAAMTCTYNLLSLDEEFYGSNESSESSPSFLDGNPSSAENTWSGATALEYALYPTIRYACLVFTNQFLWPLPRSSGIQLKLSLLLTQCLEDLRLAGGFIKHPEVSLWAALMGALVGLGPVRSCFMQVCRTCLDILSPVITVGCWEENNSCNDKVNFKADVEDNFRSHAAPDSLLLWEDTLQVCRKFLIYEGKESSLGFNLGQVRDEALATWSRAEVSQQC